MSKKSSSKQNPVTQSANDRNPNNGGFKASLDNRSRQLNGKSVEPINLPVKKQ